MEIFVKKMELKITSHPIDISWPHTSKATSWRDGLPSDFEAKSDFDKNGSRVTFLHVNAHTGTHVDAPSHFIKDGQNIDQVSLSHFIGSAVVFDFSNNPDVNQTQLITEEHIRSCHLFESHLKAGAISKADIALFKTRNSIDLAPDAAFCPSFVSLGHSAAVLLRKCGVKCVGIDFIGIERSDLQPGHDTHLELLSNDISIVEGLRLGHVSDGLYTFVCLPLKLVGLEAAPARAVLFS